jgi:hypothetical protein
MSRPEVWFGRTRDRLGLVPSHWKGWAYSLGIGALAFVVCAATAVVTMRFAPDYAWDVFVPFLAFGIWWVVLATRHSRPPYSGG